MIGSKRLTALEQDVEAIRRTADQQAADLVAGQSADDALAARLDAVDAALDRASGDRQSLAGRIDALEAELGRLGEIEGALARLTDALAAEQAERIALQGIVAKLEQRADAQADESRVTAIALLERMESVSRSRADAASGQASAR